MATEVGESLGGGQGARQSAGDRTGEAFVVDAASVLLDRIARRQSMLRQVRLIKIIDGMHGGG
jgi:hypothetical protein